MLQALTKIQRLKKLLRQGLLSCSCSTFYKYCRLLHVTQPAKRKTKSYEPLRTAAPLVLLHMDVTIDKQVVPGSKIFLHVIRDNYSRAIPGCKAAATCKNKGEVESWLGKAGLLWQKVVAQVNIIQSNSMVEAANKILKYQFLQHLQFTSLAELQAALPAILEAYNNRPLACLYGLTPAEVLLGL